MQLPLDLPPVEMDEATILANLEAMQDLSDAHTWPARLLEIADVFEATFSALKTSMRELSSRQAAELMVLALARNQGGRPVYLPAGEDINDALRARRVYRDSGKMRMEDLARREGVCVQTIYRDLARIRAIEKRRRQPGLI